ncbi:MAG: hypothetical protein JW888_18355, partial [Pirellulales bacterium]|nr:hypothetical protein [Pirellulales bacterium]
MSPIAESIIDRLDATRQRWWLFTLLATAALATSISLAVLVAFLAADSLWRLSQPVLWVMFLTWLAISLGLAAALARRLLRGQRSLEATARRVEAEFPELGSNLINVVQLAGGAASGDEAFCRAAIGQAAGALGAFRFDRAAGRVGRWRRFRFCMQTPRDWVEASVALVLVLALALGCSLLIPTWGSAARRFFAPWTFVPQRGEVEIVEVVPGDTEVLIGTGLEITATITNRQGKPHGATAWIAAGDEEEVSLPMTADDARTHYRLAIPTVAEPLEYRLEIGDSQTRVYRVGVRRKPTIADVEIVYHFPA